MERIVIRGYLSLALRKFLLYPPQHLSYFPSFLLLRPLCAALQPPVLLQPTSKPLTRDLPVLTSNRGQSRLRQIAEISLKGPVTRILSVFITPRPLIIPRNVIIQSIEERRTRDLDYRDRILPSNSLTLISTLCIKIGETGHRWCTLMRIITNERTNSNSRTERWDKRVRTSDYTRTVSTSNGRIP